MVAWPTKEFWTTDAMPNMTKYGNELPIALLNILPNPVLVKDDALRYVWINTAFEELFGVTKEGVIGQVDAELFPDRQVAQCNGGDLRVLEAGLVDEAYETVFGPDGKPLEMLTRKSRLTLSNGQVLLAGVMHDITDITHANRELEHASTLLQERATELQHQAETDALTGCLNRRALFERAPEFGKDRSVGVLLMDLDKFKMVNDTFGHEGGDQALQAFVDCARRHLRRTDIFARLGGEEFAVIVPDMPLNELYAVANRIRAAWECTPLVLAGQKAQLTVSIGAVLWRAQGALDLDAALAAADRNLYAAKEAGRNRVVADAA